LSFTQLVVFGVQALQTPFVQPCAPQSIVAAGSPSLPHVTAFPFMQKLAFGMHVLQRSIWQPFTHVCGFVIVPLLSH